MRLARLGTTQRVLASLICALCATAAAGTEARFFVPRPELLSQVKTIGVLPVEVVDDVPNKEEVAARLEEAITARLQAGGFTVVPPGAMRAIRARGAQSLGGVYDPMTGAPIGERVAALEEFAQQEYRIQHPVDATLRVAVVRRRAVLSSGAVADWDGVRQRISSEKRVTAAFQAAMSPRGIPVSALSLAAELQNLSGDTVYKAFGGLLALEYPTWSDSLVRYDLWAFDPKLAMGDPALTARAVGLALDPLVTGVSPGEPIAFTLPPPKEKRTALKELLRSHRRLALASLELPELAVEQRPRVQARYRKLLAASFAALGFELVGGSAFDDLWSAERATSGGFYDRFTGGADLARVNAAQARVLAALRERHEVSAVIIPGIATREAKYTLGYARWDGVTQSVTGGGSFLHNKSPFNADFGYSGELDAISLRLRIVDDSGTVLFQGVGGVQLIQHLDHGRVVPVPAADWFAPGNDSLAVKIGLQALMQQPPQTH